jgi:hypothetical protein
MLITGLDSGIARFLVAEIVQLHPLCSYLITHGENL